MSIQNAFLQKRWQEATAYYTFLTKRGNLQYNSRLVASVLFAFATGNVQVKQIGTKIGFTAWQKVNGGVFLATKKRFAHHLCRNRIIISRPDIKFLCQLTPKFVRVLKREVVQSFVVLIRNPFRGANFKQLNNVVYLFWT